MEKTVLLSILPQWAEAILNGKKKWEYRRVSPKNINKGSRIVLYATRNQQEIVGEFMVGVVLREPVLALIKHTLPKTPHTKEEIRFYFSGLRIGYALEVKKYRKYKKPIPLTEIKKRIPFFTPPQNFLYLRENDPRHKALLELLPSPLKKTQKKKIKEF